MLLQCYINDKVQSARAKCCCVTKKRKQKKTLCLLMSKGTNESKGSTSVASFNEFVVVIISLVTQFFLQCNFFSGNFISHLVCWQRFQMWPWVSCIKIPTSYPASWVQGQFANSFIINYIIFLNVYRVGNNCYKIDNSRLDKRNHRDVVAEQRQQQNKRTKKKL